MATTNLSEYDFSKVPSADNYKFGIVVSEWNERVTKALAEGAVKTLEEHGANPELIDIKTVPGTFELTYGAKMMVHSLKYDAVIALGCVIQGETRHFDFICQGVTQGITELNSRYDVPVIFGVLTTDDQLQAEERAGGRYGNKGDEAAVTAIKMAELRSEAKAKNSKG